MQTDELLEELRDIHFSAPLSEKVLSMVAAVSQSTHLDAGHYLFREGSTNHNLYLIREGRIALDINVPSFGQTRILTLERGDMVGWSAVIGKGQMVASALALEDSELIALSGEKLLDACEANHEVGYEVMRRMAGALAQRLVATRLQLLDLFHDRPPDINPHIEAPR